MAIPYIVSKAIRRTPEPTIPGEYSEDLKMWVIENKGVLEPLIDSGIILLEFTTKNNSNNKKRKEVPSTDNTLLSNSGMLRELATKTEATPEQDDEYDQSMPINYPILYNAQVLRELLTKTKVKPEQDDEEVLLT